MMATYYVDSSVGNNSNAGTSPGSGNAWATIDKAATTIAAGDTVYIEAIAKNASSYPTSSLDYTPGQVTSAAGNSTAGLTRWIGRNGVPTIGTPGLLFYYAEYQSFEGLYLVATAATNASYGMIYTRNACVVNRCTLNTNNKAGMAGVTLYGSLAIGCEFLSGTTSPSTSSGADLVICDGNNNRVIGNRIHHSRSRGIYEISSGMLVLSNTIWGCVGDSIGTTNTNSDYGSFIANNTIDGGSSHGIAVTGTSGIMAAWIMNNLITGHLGSGKYGIEVTNGTTSANDSKKIFCNYNCLYNNTADYHNISAGANDLAVDPTYTSASTGDFTPTNSAVQAGFP